MKGGITKRASTKQNTVFQEILRRIVDGEYPPGHRLPVRSELEKQFRVSWFTGYKVFQRLRDDGFVTFRGRSGTFVCDHPPHLCQYGLVYPRFPQNPDSIFRKALMLAARQRSAEEPRSFKTYFAETGQQAYNRDYAALVEDILGKRLSGLMIMDPPSVWESTPVLEDPWIKRVALIEQAKSQGLPFIDVDWAGLVDRAMAYLADKGCTRVGIITAHYYHLPCDDMMATADRHGMTCRRYWVQYCAKTHPEAAGNAARLLTRDLLRDNGDHPAGLVILDDHFLEGASEGLADMGVDPTRLVVVGHANFPLPVTGPFPITHLGYDAREAMGLFIDTIDALRRGGPAQTGHVLAPRFAGPDDLPQS